MKIYTPECLHPMQLNLYTGYSEMNSEGLPAQIVDKSLQSHILEFEHEDSKRRGRFGSEQNIQRWMSVGRFVYALTEGQDLRGISWFRYSGPDEFSQGYKLTFGIRLYEGAVKRGFCMPFMQAVHSDIAQYHQGNGVWLSAKQDNLKAIDKYEQFGYEYHHRDRGIVYMVNSDALVV